MKKLVVRILFLALAFLGGAVTVSMLPYRLSFQNRPPEFSKPPLPPKFKASECHPAKVQWYDAAFFFDGKDLNYAEDWHNYLGRKVTFGCVAVQGDVLLVVNEFEDGKIGQPTFIPSKWVWKIEWLQGGKEKK